MKTKTKKEVKPRWSVGSTVQTRGMIPVKCRGIRKRLYLYLLPGTDWQVVSVREDPPRLPTYKIRCGSWTITRKEHRLK